MAQKATLENVESINYDGSTLEVTFESAEGVNSLEEPQSVSRRFDVGEWAFDDNLGGLEFRIDNIPDKTAGEYFIEEKDMTVSEYNSCSPDQPVYEGKYRGTGKTYAVPESRFE